MPAITATYFEISEYGDEAKELKDLSNISYECTEEGAGVINTINRERRARHHKIGTRNYTLEFETAVGVVEEVDWRGLWREGVIFVLTYDEAGSGRRYQFVDCRVTDIAATNDTEGEYMHTVSIVPLDMVQIS